MRYVIALCAVAIIGSAAWIVFTKAPSWFGEEVVYAAPTDEGALRTIAAVDKIKINSPGRAYRKNKLIPADVTKVFNGDTIEVFLDGELMIVGYLGVNAPDLESPVFGPEPFAVEALERNREIVEGKTVLLEGDLVEIDRLDRHLRYVYVGELMVNALLLHEGLAKADTSSFALKYSDIIHKVEQQAIIERKGGWRKTWPNIVRRQ